MSSKLIKPQNDPKLLAFKVFAIAVPVICLILAEIGLRLFNYGHNTGLFVPYPNDSRYLQVNNYAAEKFFSDTVNATHGSGEIFTVDKAPNTFRIFVLGESTTIGYPYFHNGSFHRWLQFRLMQHYPGKNFEVVNVAMTALNSYAVLDFGKQLCKYQPDAVLIYTGHNEYYGAMGIGSTNFISSNRFVSNLVIGLREMKTVQLLNNMISRIRSSFGRTVDTRQNLMKRMAAQQEIPYLSKAYQAGIDQFRLNMTDLCSFLNKNNVPVFLGTVVSNQKDQAPFISKGTGGASAIYNYHQGQLHYQKKDFDAARQYFRDAKECDELRFRAPEAINKTIYAIGNKYRYVYIVDTKGLFEKNSPHGIVGQETMLEHVHPNLYGYALMSEAFYQVFEKEKLFKDAPLRKVDLGELLRDMPVTPLDSLIGQYQISLLQSGWPFNKPLPASFKIFPTLTDSLAYAVARGRLQWKDAMSTLFERAQINRDRQQQLKIVEALALEYPQNEQFCGFAATLSAELGKNETAALYYRTLNRIRPDSRLVAKAIKSYVRADLLKAALATVSELPVRQQTQVRDILTGILHDVSALSKDPADKAASDNLALNYRKLGIAGTPFISK